MLTAALALAGFYFYVFIYTRWLKRSTPQNIVIGGAAGAFPPLVGWAAVTNRVDLLAVYLFLIIFYWTPPHFWALALLKQKDYGRAGVPMAPLVWGERETKRQMLWYTLILIPLTLLPVRVRRARARLPRVARSCSARMFLVEVRARDARDGVEQAGVAALQVLAALPRAALRRDGRRPRIARLTPPLAAPRRQAAASQASLAKTARPPPSATCGRIAARLAVAGGLSRRRRRRRARVSRRSCDTCSTPRSSGTIARCSIASRSACSRSSRCRA